MNDQAEFRKSLDCVARAIGMAARLGVKSRYIEECRALRRLFDSNPCELEKWVNESETATAATVTAQ